ncbi:calmodulin [Drosophila serrata]|uniref:calmodulin n=1 Tax=Drosophila serrata TaxID=7274 RepID=UPI000A1D2BCE|nr:calmodulin [Drosophila serrata]
MVDLSEDQIEEIREAFFVYDNENTGWVTTKQMLDVMRTLGQSLTEAELYAITSEYCLHSGLVYFNEFLQMMTKRLEEQNSIANLQQAFRIFDRNDVQYFTVVELRAVMINLGEKISDDDLLEMFKDIDLDNDGRVTFSDFVTAMRS